MADNVTFTDSGTGAVPNATVIRTRQLASGAQMSMSDVSPMAATTVSGGQYALSVGTSSPTSLTVPSTATHCWISVDTGGTATGIRWTRDGQSPSSTVGHFLPAGDAIELDNLSAIRLVGITAAATVQVSYHKYQ